jgi:hypothetical protein
MTNREKKCNRNRTQYRYGWYKKPSEHHGHPTFIKYRPTKEPTKSHTDGYSRTPDNLEIIGHVYILPTTHRRFLATLTRKAARAKNIRRQRLSSALSRS